MPKTVAQLVARYFSRLRFPRLFALTALLFIVDLVFPDAVPFIDELLLGLGATLLGSWKERRREKRLGSTADRTPVGIDSERGERTEASAREE